MLIIDLLPTPLVSLVAVRGPDFACERGFYNTPPARATQVSTSCRQQTQPRSRLDESHQTLEFRACWRRPEW